MNPFSVTVSSLAAIRPPAASKSRRARHPRHDLALALDSQQRAKCWNSPGEFLRPVNRINDQSRAVRSTGISLLAGAHLLSQHIQRESAGRHFSARHLFHGAIRLRHRSSVTLSFDAHLVPAKILHRDCVRLARNRFQQLSVLRSIAHHLPCAFLNRTRLDQSRSRPLAYKVSSMSAQANTGTVLDRILDARRAAVDHRKKVLPETALKYGATAATPLRDFAAALSRAGLHILAELKPASPSRR